MTLSLRVGSVLLFLPWLMLACRGGDLPPKADGAPSVITPSSDPNTAVQPSPSTSSATTGTTPSPSPLPASGAARTSFFGPYKDVTVNANWNTAEISTLVTGSLTPVVRVNPALKLVTWSFATGECGAETWGGLAASQLVAANVPAWSAAGVRFVVSTGGANGAFTCGTDAGFSAFLDRYASSSFAGVDFDIEAGQDAAAVADLVARVAVAEANPKYAGLRFSFTIATLGGSGGRNLGAQGEMVMRAIQAGKLQHYTVNLMAMNYGSTNAANCGVGSDGSCDMGQSAINAAKSLHDVFGVAYDQIELTPMIGGNDTRDETFNLRDAATVAAYVREAGLAGLHYWSLDRDVDCPAGPASPTCNNFGAAKTLGFFDAFSRELDRSK